MSVVVLAGNGGEHGRGVNPLDVCHALADAQVVTSPAGRDSVKRAFDLTVCLLTLPFAIPAMFVIGLAVRLDSPGPALFSQIRVGKDGRPFRLYKFRTCRDGHDTSEDLEFMRAYIQGHEPGGGSPAARFKPDHRGQTTRVGRFLRATSLDELPQLINIARGEMSLVGPRPNIPEEVELYRPDQRKRLTVLPGITGLAQIKGRSDLTFEQIVTYDIEYIDRRNLRTDWLILLRTVIALFRRTGVA
jgi:lipopolysaccharide/colanic/teichoic acid biosynthesis glycosyltransferase